MHLLAKILLSLGALGLLLSFLKGNIKEWVRMGIDSLCDKFPCIARLLRENGKTIEDIAKEVEEGLDEAIQDQEIKDDTGNNSKGS